MRFGAGRPSDVYLDNCFGDLSRRWCFYALRRIKLRRQSVLPRRLLRYARLRAATADLRAPASGLQRNSDETYR